MNTVEGALIVGTVMKWFSGLAIWNLTVVVKENTV